MYDEGDAIRAQIHAHFDSKSSTDGWPPHTTKAHFHTHNQGTFSHHRVTVTEIKQLISASTISTQGGHVRNSHPQGGYIRKLPG